MTITKREQKILLSCYANKELADSIKEIAKNESLSRSLIMRLAMKKFVTFYKRGVYNVL